MENRVERDPQFNSGLAYLELFHTFMQRFHSVMQSNAFSEAMDSLISARILLSGRLRKHKKVSEETRLKDLETECKNLVFGVRADSYLVKNKLWSFCEEIEACAHREGLRMPDKDGSAEATRA